jgi:hypothetical protein
MFLNIKNNRKNSDVLPNDLAREIAREFTQTSVVFQERIESDLFYRVR